MLAPVADDLARVDALIRRRLDSDVALVRQVAEYIVGARAASACARRCCCSPAAPLGYRAEARLPLAAVVEFIHTATLLHDDVVDASRAAPRAQHRQRGVRQRRGGAGGRFPLLARLPDDGRDRRHARHAGARRGHQYHRRGRGDAADGQPRPRGRRGALPRGDPAQDRQAVRGGGAPRRSAVETGNVRSNALAEYGRHVGTAFQLIDDVLDYRRATIGKSLGDDLAEGKPTLPLIYTMRCGTREQAERGAQGDRRGRTRGLRARAGGDPRQRRARLRARRGASARPRPRRARSPPCRSRSSSNLC